MTADTTTRIPLGDAAKAAIARQAEQAKARAAEKRQHYIRDAKAAADRVARNTLGDYATGVEWTPEGEDSGSGNWLQATATIDGLSFRAVERYYSAGEWGSGFERTLYLRQPCPSGEHEPADREIEVHGLAGLGAILTNPENWETAWRCFACKWQRDPENPDNQQDTPPVPPPSTVEERLAGVLREYVDGIVGERLDGFLATYLPDRI